MPPIKPMVFITPSSGKALRDLAESLDYLVIGRTLERNDQRGGAAQPLPAPGIELGAMLATSRGMDVDLAFLAGKGEGKPALALPAIFALEGDAQGFVGQVVIDPLAGLGEEAHRGDIGFFVQFAQGGAQRVLAIVNAPLGHLPGKATRSRLIGVTLG